MKLSLGVFAFLMSHSAHAVATVTTPYHISLEALRTTAPTEQHEDSDLIDALTQTGMITIGGLSNSFKEAMRTVTSTQHECLMASKNTLEQTYPDGTVRVTLATHTVAGLGGQQALLHQTFNVNACDRWETATHVVRATTQEVVAALSTKLSTLLGVTNGPLLMTHDRIIL